MIQIRHPDLESISTEYSKIIKVEFIDKINSALAVIKLLNESKKIEKSDVERKVNQLSTAVKFITGIDELLDSMEQSGKGKRTKDLIFTLNQNRSNATKDNYEDIKIKINKLKIFTNENNLFGSKPDELLKLNDGLKDVLGLISARFHNYFFNYQKYYKALNNGIGIALNLKCCPYCNRNYITYIPDKKERVIGPSYDHFFSKNRYKYLTLSFYNLIPSCYICNSNLKGNAKFKLDTHIHPYLGGFGNDVLFDFDLVTKNQNNKKHISFQPTLIQQNTLKTKKKEKNFWSRYGKKFRQY